MDWFLWCLEAVALVSLVLAMLNGTPARAIIASWDERRQVAKRLDAIERAVGRDYWSLED